VLPVLVSVGPIKTVPECNRCSGRLEGYKRVEAGSGRTRVAHDNLELCVQERTLELEATLVELQESREELKFLLLNCCGTGRRTKENCRRCMTASGLR